MPLNNPTADGQSQAHALALRSEKGVEQPRLLVGVKPDTGVLDRYEYLVSVITPASDPQLSWPLRDRIHGFDAVSDQVQKHLLQLNRIPQHRRESGREFRAQGHSMCEQFVLHQRERLPDDLLEV